MVKPTFARNEHHLPTKDEKKKPLQKLANFLHAYYLTKAVKQYQPSKTLSGSNNSWLLPKGTGSQASSMPTRAARQAPSLARTLSHHHKTERGRSRSGTQGQTRVKITEGVCGDGAGPRSSQEVCPWIRVQISRVHGQVHAWLWLTWREAHVQGSSSRD